MAYRSAYRQYLKLMCLLTAETSLNPWSCDCFLQWLRVTLDSNSILLNDMETVCHWPPPQNNLQQRISQVAPTTYQCCEYSTFVKHGTKFIWPFKKYTLPAYNIILPSPFPVRCTHYLHTPCQPYHPLQCLPDSRLWPGLRPLPPGHVDQGRGGAQLHLACSHQPVRRHAAL